MGPSGRVPLQNLKIAVFYSTQPTRNMDPQPENARPTPSYIGNGRLAGGERDREEGSEVGVNLQ